MSDPIYLDCDTGVDDALAIALLLGTPHAELLGVGTVTGNTGAAQAARNTLDLLALGGRGGVPVAVGARHALDGSSTHDATVVHGGNGIGGVELPRAAAGPVPVTAVDLLLALARARPGELRILATGPLTNLAMALRREPRLPELIRDVTVMGGAVRVPGNVTGHSEANIAVDPEAAAEVLAAAWPVTLVPLDVTMRHRFGPGDQEALRAHGTPLSTALAAMLTGYFDYYEPVLGERRVPLHDPLAAAVLTGAAGLSDAPMLGLRVEVDGRRGAVVEDASAGRQTRVVLDVADDTVPRIRELVLAAG
ncbi:nucleoside hydrolase [Nucisporomicrobium flavum]|uniref:nucleoside hydrolase n=1 Tax=Nucisporomicrobium flavum TaxID=2785915 RepID=UPI0018F4D998|nr:nucleoside hydrolase [Nucisporomicrobium flavum]